METFQLYFELIGAVAFAISGAALGIRKGMDLFGVAMVGMTTAVGGGILRDVMLHGAALHLHQAHICLRVSGRGGGVPRPVAAGDGAGHAGRLRRDGGAAHLCRRVPVELSQGVKRIKRKGVTFVTPFLCCRAVTR